MVNLSYVVIIYWLNKNCEEIISMIKKAKSDLFRTIKEECVGSLFYPHGRTDNSNISIDVKRLLIYLQSQNSNKE